MRGMWIVVWLLGIASPCLGLEWIQLHNKANDQNRAFSQITANSPTIEQRYILALSYLNRYQIEKAKAEFEKMLDEKPDLMEARWGIAEILRREHKYRQSRELLKDLLKEDSTFAPAWMTLAYIHYIQMDFKETARLTGKVINFGQDNVDEMNFIRAHGLYAAAKGMIAHYGGPFLKAINGAAVLKHLAIIRRIDPDSPIATFGYGSYYMLIPEIFGRDLEKSKIYLEETIKNDPFFPDPYVRLAQIYKFEGNQKKYEELIQKALSLDPRNELALDIQSRSCKYICLKKEK